MPNIVSQRSDAACGRSRRTVPKVSGNRPGNLRGDELIDLGGIIGFLKGQYPHSTAHAVEADTGISARTVECWLERRSSPSLAHGLKLSCVYGPCFLAAAFTSTPECLEQATRAEELRSLDAQEAEILARRLRLQGKKR